MNANDKMLADTSYDSCSDADPDSTYFDEIMLMLMLFLCQNYFLML